MSALIVAQPRGHAALRSVLIGLLWIIVVAGLLIAGWWFDTTREGFFVAMALVFLLGLHACIAGAWLQGRENSARCAATERFARGEGHAAFELDRFMMDRVLGNLQTQAQLGADRLDPDAFLDEAKLRLNVGGRRAALCAGVCVSLGIAGTGVGMLECFDGLAQLASEGQLRAGDGGASLFALLFGSSGPLRDIGTALQTTVLGAVMGIALRVLAYLHAGRTSRLVSSMRSMIETWVRPQLEKRALENLPPNQEAA